MSIALKIASGTITQIGAADTLDVNTIRQNAGGNPNLLSWAANVLTLGVATDTVTIPGNLDVDGTMTVSSTATYEGNVNLGNGGDIINIGSGTSDTVNLNANLTVGAALVKIGSAPADRLAELWLDSAEGATTSGPNAAGYDLHASGTNAGAYAIGVDTSLLENIGSLTGVQDLMTVLDRIDAAVGGTSETLQEAYENGNTISVVSGDGTVSIATTTDGTNALTLNSTTAGAALTVTASGAGDAVFINRTAGAGDILQVQRSGTDVFDIDAAGKITATPTSGQNFVATTAGAGTIALTAAAAVTVDSTGAGVSIDGNANSNFTVTAGQLTLSTVTSGDINVDSADEVFIKGATAVKIRDSAGTTDVVTVTGAGAFSATPTSGQNAVIETGGAGTITLETNGSADLNVIAAGVLNMDAASATLDTSTTFSIDGGSGTSNITQANGALTITAGSASTWSTSSGNLTVQSAADLNLTAAADADVVMSTSDTGAIQITAAAGAAVGGAIALATTTLGGTAGNITVLSTGGSDNAGDIIIGSTATSNANSGGLVLYAGGVQPTPVAAGINIVAQDDLVLAASSTTDITFQAQGSSAIPFNDSTDFDLAPAFNSGSIVGALNELKAGVGATVVEFASIGSASAGEAVKITGNNAVDQADANDGESATIGVLLNDDAAPYRVVVCGLITGVLSGATAGNRYFVSDTTLGGLTTTAPTIPDLVRRIGWAKNETDLVVLIGEGAA